MKRRILVAILSIAALAIVLFGAPLAIVVERLVDEDAMSRVERQAVLATRDVPAGFATSSDPVELPATNDGVVLALYGTDGKLLSGTGPASADAPTTRALANEVTDIETESARVVAVPVSANEQIIGAIRAEQSTAGSDSRTARIVALIAVLAFGVLGVGAVIGYFLASRLARPVLRLRDAAVQLGDGDFTIDVPSSNVPEVDQAAVALNATARRLDDLVGRERSFSADASHQLRTPLAGLRAAIEAELEFPRADRTQVLRDALEDIDRLERTITELLTIARTTSPANEGTVSLADLLGELEQSWHGPLAVAGRPLTIADPSDLPIVRGNRMMLGQAMNVLLDNALTHGAGEVRVDHAVASNTVTITVADEGPGFPDPPHNSRSPNGSVDELPHGLGIPLARRLIEAQPGRLSFRRLAPHPQIDVVLQRTDPPATTDGESSPDVSDRF